MLIRNRSVAVQNPGPFVFKGLHVPQGCAAKKSVLCRRCGAMRVSAVRTRTSRFSSTHRREQGRDQRRAERHRAVEVQPTTSSSLQPSPDPKWPLVTKVLVQGLSRRASDSWGSSAAVARGRASAPALSASEPQQLRDRKSSLTQEHLSRINSKKAFHNAHANSSITAPR